MMFDEDWNITKWFEHSLESLYAQFLIEWKVVEQDKQTLFAILFLYENQTNDEILLLSLNKRTYDGNVRLIMRSHLLLECDKMSGVCPT